MSNQEQSEPMSTELPMPMPEKQVEPAPSQELTSENVASQHLEQGVSPAATPAPQQPITPVAAADPVQHTSPLDDPMSQMAILQMSPQIADDTDLIEKEWVIKAKHIVEKTKHDPYQQNKDMNSMKADYLKKRYNKDVKLGG